MTYFPFDSQTCNIHLNSLDYFAEELEFRLVSNQVTTIGHYNIDAEWSVVSTKVATGQITVSTHIYNRVRVMFQVARKPLFAILNIVIPIVTISILSMMVFLVPVESGEKLSFSLSALLSLAVFMSFITEQIPASSEKAPLLVIYLTLMVLLNALSVVSTVLVLLCHYRGHVNRETAACGGKGKKNIPASRTLNNTLLLLFMGVVIGITIGIMAKMTNNN
ncbi:neuronal acetylcholine receptor subunit beta-3-like [Haliotis asinina]|uniref:neuronal acetylcholine receptor subunit beta-3-like n=1 Tax=Haliotis asinina TaxID=109174 RepID=UPI0035318833